MIRSIVIIYTKIFSSANIVILQRETLIGYEPVTGLVISS